MASASASRPGSGDRCGPRFWCAQCRSVSARTRQRVAALEQRLEHSDRGPGSRALQGVGKFRAGSAARAAQVAAWHALEPDALDTLSPNATTLVPCASARAGAGAPLLRGARTTARL